MNETRSKYIRYIVGSREVVQLGGLILTCAVGVPLIYAHTCKIWTGPVPNRSYLIKHSFKWSHNTTLCRNRNKKTERPVSTGNEFSNTYSGTYFFELMT